MWRSHQLLQIDSALSCYVKFLVCYVMLLSHVTFDLIATIDSVCIYVELRWCECSLCTFEIFPRVHIGTCVICALMYVCMCICMYVCTFARGCA